MPTWTPSPIWQGQDAFIIGGGPSLQGFDFNLLKGRNVIGVNDAFRLGPQVVSFTLFADASFWNRSMRELETAGMPIVSIAPSLQFINVPWLYQMGRVRHGVHEGPVLGWNESTGAAAVNLAHTLGASRIFLLGYDCGRRKEDGRRHWHNHSKPSTPESSYQRFITGFHNLYMSMKRFPEVKVLNVTDGTSQLPKFERIDFNQFHRILGATEAFNKWMERREVLV